MLYVCILNKKIEMHPFSVSIYLAWVGRWDLNLLTIKYFSFGTAGGKLMWNNVLKSCLVNVEDVS